MDTQNTPIHIKLWHKDFWHIALAGLCLTTAVYMLLPVLPIYFLLNGYSVGTVALCFLAYAVGLYLPGGFLSGLVQHHRRHRVSMVSMLVFMLIVGFYYFFENHHPVSTVIACLLAGSAFSLAQMTMLSTLIIDTCQSFQRTEANHAASWFRRFALALGPFFGFWIYYHLGFESMMLSSSVLALIAMVLVGTVNFPFRAPEDIEHRFSLDRFYLVQGTLLFLNLVMITFAMGLLISTQLTIYFFMVMMAGFLLAILSEKFVFADADLKSETFVGCVLIAIAIMLVWFRYDNVAQFTASALFGFGIGLIGSRFLLFFIKLARHCERGTSQSSHFLAWETGIALGLGAGYFIGEHETVFLIALVTVAVAFILYNYIIHPWYLQNKNR